jgi:capsular exopolysaccharide synthesis family protein
MGNAKGVLDAGLKEILVHNVGALAAVQGSILSAAEGRDVRTILVTSANRLDGKTVTAVGMATSLANHANAEVLLVDANLPNPALHRHFGVEERPGFSDFLTTSIGLDEVVVRTDVPQLLLMPRGGAAATLFDVTRGNAFATQLASLRSKFDYVICDGSAVFGSSDASMVASHFDGIVLVLECERTRWEVAQDAKERIVKAGGRILGVALNKRRYYIPSALYAGA